MKGKCLQNLVLLLLSGIILCSACGCSGRQKQVVTIGQDTIVHKRLKPMNSIYYWRTIFNPSEKELTFLKRQNVGRMYLRMF